MARCPLCSTRSAKRFCPAKETSICAICCGEKREVEIDCPSSCPHLQAGRAYEAARTPVAQLNTPDLARYDEYFLQRFSGLIHGLSYAAVVERQNFPGLIDADVVQTYKALQATMKTLESGIYYESMPEGAASISLFRRLKAALDEVMQPRPEPGYHALRPAEAIDVLGFLILSASVESGARPRSRRYLDWIATHIAPAQPPREEASRIVLP